MTMDPSLRDKSGLIKHRNVLTRAERIKRLSDRGRFDSEQGDPLGLPKVANRKAVAVKKPKKATDEEETEATPPA